MTSTLLVPVDFTPASSNAFTFARELAKIYEAEIILLHVIESESDQSIANQQLESFSNIIENQKSFIDKIILVGKLTEQIELVCLQKQIDFIILGTHVITGISKIFRSNAFKIVEDVSSPLIMVQEKTQFKDIRKIVLTIDLQRESVQIVNIAVKIAKLFKAEIVLVAKNEPFEEHKEKTNVNLIVSQKYLEEKNVTHKVLLVEPDKYLESIFEICQSENADLLAATYYQQHIHLFTESFVQSLAFNRLNIPLLTMDEESTYTSPQFGAMWG